MVDNNRTLRGLSRAQLISGFWHWAYLIYALCACDAA